MLQPSRQRTDAIGLAPTLRAGTPRNQLSEANRMSRKLWRRPPGYGLCAASLAALSILTWHQSAMYTDVETLWQTTIERNPSAWMAHNNLGAILLRKGQPKEAMARFRRALEIKADHAGAQANLGDALLQEGQLDEAIAHYQTALEIKPQDVKAQANLAWALAICPETPLLKGTIAVKLAQQANQLTGGANAMVLHVLAAAYAQSGRFAEALETAQRSLQLATAQNNTALAGSLRMEIERYQKGFPYRIGNYPP
jgi:tetratricopeptide (TPR) repeat protein